ncbi:MAG: hypothetical protein KKD38_10045 [Candidatus Delongbacteria bacterium]|nr:hypothetical protein [Candidatus Delongbacteria bacterium]MCG2760839.1 hypothetical protein [Candidatus Delongbacteria bacterium]
MKRMMIILVLISISLAFTQKFWEEEGWALTARNLNHEGVKNKSKSDLSQLFEQYLEKASSLKELDELKNNYGQKQIVWFDDALHLFKNLINIKKIKELIELGVNLNHRGFDNIKSRSAFSQIILTGVVIDDVKTESERGRCFKVKVQEMLKGKFFINVGYDYFNLFYYVRDDERDTYYYPKHKPIEKNRQYLFFIDKISWDADNRDNYKKVKNNEVSLDDSAFRVLYYSIDPHQSPDSVKFNDLIKEYPPSEFRTTGITHYRDLIYSNEIDSLKFFLEIYEKINDTPNFFNRKY